MKYITIHSYLYREGSKHDPNVLHVWKEIEGQEIAATFRGSLCDAVLKQVQPFKGREENYFFAGEFDQNWFSDGIKKNQTLGFRLPETYKDHFVLVEEPEPEPYDPTRDPEFQRMAADMLADVGDADGAWAMMGDMGMYEGQTYIEEKYFCNDQEPEEEEPESNLKLVKKTG